MGLDQYNAKEIMTEFSLFWLNDSFKTVVLKLFFFSLRSLIVHNNIQSSHNLVLITMKLPVTYLIFENFAEKNKINYCSWKCLLSSDWSFLACKISTAQHCIFLINLCLWINMRCLFTLWVWAPYSPISYYMSHKSLMCQIEYKT